MTTPENRARATLSGGRDKYVRLNDDAWGLIDGATRVNVTTEWTDDGLLIKWRGALEDESTRYGSPYLSLALRHTISGVRFVTNRLLTIAGANTDELPVDDRSGSVTAYGDGWFGFTVPARRLSEAKSPKLD